jgi:hypothetical protein
MDLQHLLAQSVSHHKTEREVMWHVQVAAVRLERASAVRASDGSGRWRQHRRSENGRGEREEGAEDEGGTHGVM